QATGEHRARASAAPRSAARRNEPPRPTEEVALTHPDRVLFPKSKLTKRDVFEYYRRVASAMVPALAGRPLAVQQWPKGIGAEGFFRKNIEGAPKWATPVDVKHERRQVKHLIVDRPEPLLWLANQSALTLHMWSSRVPHPAEPDWVVFDLDPVENGWAQLIRVAVSLRGMLEQLPLASAPKTAGKRGLRRVGRGARR